MKVSNVMTSYDVIIYKWRQEIACPRRTVVCTRYAGCGLIEYSDGRIWTADRDSNHEETL